MRSPSYRGPVVAAAVLAAIVALWARSAWKDRLAVHRAGLHQYAEGLFGAASLFQDPPSQRGPVPPDHFSGALARLLEESRALRFAAMLDRGERVAWAGPAPRDLRAAGERGERVAGGVLILWRRLHPPPRRHEGTAPPGPGARPGGPPPPGFPGAHPPGRPPPLVLVLGFDLALHPVAKFSALVDIGVRAGAALLLGVALLLVWGQGIRRRRLAADLEASRRQQEHLEELSLAAAGLVHETKNPLGIIRGLAQRIAADAGVPGESRDRADRIVDESDRAGARLGDFLAFARLPAPRPVPVEAAALLRRAAAVLQDDFDEAAVALAVQADGGWILADAEQVLQVLLNLLLNALEACAAGARVTVRFLRDGARGTLVIEDTGRGIPPALRDAVWKPYVSGRPDGHGLGLAIVRRLVEQHGWAVALESEAGRGTRVTVTGLAVVEPGPEGGAVAA